MILLFFLVKVTAADVGITTYIKFSILYELSLSFYSELLYYSTSMRENSVLCVKI